MLETVGLSWRLGDVGIVDDVSLSLEQGSFLGVIGPNGAGKTSLFNLITGVRRPSAGRVVLDGRDIAGFSTHRRAQLGLGRTFQASSVFGALSVRENVRLGVQAKLGGSFRMWRRARTFRNVAERADECLATVGLTARADALAGTLAHGEKRKLEIALLLAGSPRVMLLDEPMAGVASEDVPELVEVIRGLTRHTGGAVLMVEHHMDVILGLADRLAVMHHGALLACDTPDAVMANPVVQEAYLGEEL